MPVSTNFAFRDANDPEAANIAVAAVIRAILEETEIKLDMGRVRQLIGSACDEDINLIGRAMWFAQWMRGDYDAEGERDEGGALGSDPLGSGPLGG